jgi:hypothetical protein
MKGYLQDVQPEEVWAFWRFMQDHFRTSVVNKSSALEIQLVARGLEGLGVQSKERFLKNFTTTIGRRIYTPFEVGSPKGGWDLWHQVVICAHEHQHVVQHDREGLSYEVSCLADRAARPCWEAEAYRSNLELQFRRTGITPAAQRTASVLKDYGCRAADIEVTAKSLARLPISVSEGAVINEATHVALGWLDEHVPRLRFKQG